MVRDHVDFPSSWRSRESLQGYLERHGVPGISGIDTRALVQRLRSQGATNGVLVHGEADLERLRERAAALPPMDGQNLVDAAEAWFARGNALAHLERYEEAIAAYRQALERRPDDPKAAANIEKRWNDVTEDIGRKEQIEVWRKGVDAGLYVDKF